MTRLPLNDPEWNDLTHAYGPAGDIPELLRMLEHPIEDWAWDAEPNFMLWSTLCHQGDVYTASYAALPYLLDGVEIAPVMEGKSNLLCLAAIILALSEAKRSPPVDASTAEQFRETRTRLEQLSMTMLAELDSDPDEETLTSLFGALAVAKGQAKLGNVLFNAIEEWACPVCDAPSDAYALGR